MSKVCAVDILIIGGGLTGYALLHMLKTHGLKVRLVESKSPSFNADKPLDARTLALSKASCQILNTIGIWSEIKPYVSPIKDIHISQLKGFSRARLASPSKEPLGYVLPLATLLKQLMKAWVGSPEVIQGHVLEVDQKAQAIHVKHHEQSTIYHASLVIVADGTHSATRQKLNIKPEVKDFMQTAIVANIKLNRPHEQRAYERFTPAGPQALLPLQNQHCAMIWTMSHEEARVKSMLADALFLRAAQSAFGYRLGRFLTIGKRTTYPLQQVVMQRVNHHPYIFIGNAAQTLHPVAGQGFNLALRDGATLAQSIHHSGLGQSMAASYEAMRHKDRNAIIKSTEHLISLFSEHRFMMPFLRSIGLVIFNESSFLKSILSTYASGYGGEVCDLACGIALKDGFYESL